MKLALLLSSAFVVGGASAEVAVRTHRAVERERTVREIGAAGQLVALEVTGHDGARFARPRVIAPTGKVAELVLQDPARPGVVRLAFRVEAEREPTGDISLDYELWIPEREVSSKGKLSLVPGVELAIPLGGELTATWLAMPVPSAQFDAYLEAEGAARRAPAKAS